ncbi:hypothetical protein BRE01_02080 [Brevibacillus reuszeri]|uniref:Uncharacterized protein n=1 Tax=Brevibacillus reuszeri TaxID=54915 RepID=A0A0K9YSQ6_9BACL|nr:hypothetical protein [Brevibacillus reuszeri]KNB71225.1 hypothetical protein ADS79_20660 [Brevibacillus reuszeri]MED1857661.1 hypothetical protein [Brevibacillus reuszeri]GED66506.1 hypothetical protein BRE01_02080 [Brevibacillus reuszeri]
MLRRIPPVILIVLLLAIYGFLTKLIADPINTFIILGLCVVLFLVVRNYLQSGSFFSRASEQRKPKQTKAKASPKTPIIRQAFKKQSTTSPRKDHPFRVIDGNKGKSKEKQNDRKSQDHISH